MNYLTNYEKVDFNRKNEIIPSNFKNIDYGTATIISEFLGNSEDWKNTVLTCKYNRSLFDNKHIRLVYNNRLLNTLQVNVRDIIRRKVKIDVQYLRKCNFKLILVYRNISEYKLGKKIKDKIKTSLSNRNLDITITLKEKKDQFYFTFVLAYPEYIEAENEFKRDVLLNVNKFKDLPRVEITNDFDPDSNDGYQKMPSTFFEIPVIIIGETNTDDELVYDNNIGDWVYPEYKPKIHFNMNSFIYNEYDDFSIYPVLGDKQSNSHNLKLLEFYKNYPNQMWNRSDPIREKFKEPMFSVINDTIHIYDRDLNLIDFNMIKQLYMNHKINIIQLIPNPENYGLPSIQQIKNGIENEIPGSVVTITQSSLPPDKECFIEILLFTPAFKTVNAFFNLNNCIRFSDIPTAIIDDGFVYDANPYPSGRINGLPPLSEEYVILATVWNSATQLYTHVKNFEMNNVIPCFNNDSKYVLHIIPVFDVDKILRTTHEQNRY